MKHPIEIYLMIKQKAKPNPSQQNLYLVLHGKSQIHHFHDFYHHCPRCIVWTSDQQVFFFNPTSRISLWDRPEELKGKTH
jgi:hypothetical protein